MPDSRHLLRAFALFALGGTAAVFIAVAAASPGATERVSVDSAGVEGNAESNRPAISTDGRYVAFSSLAGNLVPGDTNLAGDVFVRDRLSGTTTRVSVDGAGNQANGYSELPSISGDGRYVTFYSGSTNLVSGDSNGVADIFVRDRLVGTTTRVSVDSAGGQADANSFAPRISADGRYVAFFSAATNLVAGDTNGWDDVFVHDRQTGTTTRVSVSSAGAEGNFGSSWSVLSSDGRYVAFESQASNLAPGDTNSTASDVFVRDRQTGTTTMVSVSSAGVQGNSFSRDPEISADGRYVAFNSTSTDLVPGDTNQIYDVFVRDRQAGTTTRVSVDSAGVEGNGGSAGPSMSSDGRYVAFDSTASNLVPQDTNGTYDVFLRDTQTGTTTRLSVDSSGGQASGDSFFPSTNGRFTAFTSSAPDLVAGDTNGVFDVFVRDRDDQTHDVGVAGGGFRTKHRIDESRMGLGPFPIDIKVKNFGTVTEDIAYAVTSTQGDSFSATCSGTLANVAPGTAVVVNGCEVTYADSANPDPVLTLTVTHNNADGRTDSDPANNVDTQSIVINP